MVSSEMPAGLRLGREVRFTLNACDDQLLDDAEGLVALANEACMALQVEVRSRIVERFAPQGVSVVCILAESHLSVHSWPERRSATVDIFTCGDTDPITVLPLFLKALGASGSTVATSERWTQGEQHHEQRYPRFEQYILRPAPSGHFPAPVFRRGIGREFLLEPEALAWQDFFCSEDYAPPSGADILLLHPCSWGKPYDMSAFVSALRNVTDRTPRVHRAILSNVGVVPFEYQMNPFFCSYDYSPAGGRYTEMDEEEARQLFAKLTRERIARYIRARRSDYRAVVLLGHPLEGGMWRTVAEVAQECGLGGFLAPSPGIYRAAQEAVLASGERDVDAPIFHELTLRHLASRLEDLGAHLEAGRAGHG